MDGLSLDPPNRLIHNQRNQAIKAIQGLSRNPLGIVALFIVLIYAQASLVFGTSYEFLKAIERFPLILFLVLFPMIVLGVFCWLVSNHHHKLYAPTDFVDEDNFLKSLSSEDERQRFVDQTSETESKITTLESINGNSTDSTRSILINPRESSWLAQSMVLRDVECQLGRPIEHHMKLLTPNSELAIDGAVREGNKLTAIEVKFSQDGSFDALSVEQMLKRTSKVVLQLLATRKIQNFSLLLALVSNKDPKNLQHIQSQIKDLAQKYHVPTTMKFYNIHELKRKFGLSEEIKYVEAQENSLISQEESLAEELATIDESEKTSHT